MSTALLTPTRTPYCTNAEMVAAWLVAVPGTPRDAPAADRQQSPPLTGVLPPEEPGLFFLFYLWMINYS
jgi:hypothetical protein